MSNDLVEGWCDPAFAPCLDAFRENVANGGELGAACAIYQHGRPVMDAWGGIAQSEGSTKWVRDTVVPFFSVTKGVAALCVLAQVSNGALALDAPVASYWPEFGVHGKDKVTIRDALAHRAGVPALEGACGLDELADTAAMAARLGAQAPLFEPGSAHLYHALTIGWITTELVRRATGLQLGRWLREQLCEPLDLNLQIGRIPADRTPIARVEVPPERDTPALDRHAFPGTVLSLGGLIDPCMSGLAAAMNNPAFQQVKLAGGNGMGDARSLARLYAAALPGAQTAPLIRADVMQEACITVSQGKQWGVGLPGPTWGAGLMLPWRVQPMLGAGSFGHDGAGGSLAFAHAPSGIAFAYVRNRAGVPDVVDPLVYRVVNVLADLLQITVPEY